MKGKTLETILFYLTAFGQEISLGFFILMFITGVSIKLSQYRHPRTVTKDEWKMTKGEYYNGGLRRKI